MLVTLRRVRSFEGEQKSERQTEGGPIPAPPPDDVAESRLIRLKSFDW